MVGRHEISNESVVEPFDKIEMHALIKAEFIVTPIRVTKVSK